MAKDFDDNEGFWEVGLHLFLILLFILPTLLLLSYLMRFEYVRNGIPLLVAMFVGIPLGHRAFRRIRRWYRKATAEVAEGE